MTDQELKNALMVKQALSGLAELEQSMQSSDKEVAQQDQVSLNQFIASAVAEKISALTTKVIWLSVRHKGIAISSLRCWQVAAC
jgi:hypothetical protein